MHIPGRLWNNPLGEAAIVRMLGGLGLAPNQTVLDVGCGNGEILARILERYSCNGVGIDPDPDEMAAARIRLAPLGPRARLLEGTVQDAEPKGPFDAAICIGSTHAFGGPGDVLEATLGALAPVVLPGGRLLIGEAHWRRPPDPDYLAATGIGVGDYVSHEDVIATAERAGWILLDAVTTPRADWDRFEGAALAYVETLAAASPDDPEAQAKADRSRAWRNAYENWGRETLGFGLYLFRNPDTSER
ncbi:MAG: methyltransferase domain-containing protein [Planctomycetota bacterium]